MNFNKIIWYENKFILDELVFNIEDRISKFEDNHIIIYKSKKQIDAFCKFFETFTNFHPKDIFEIGIWKGGSTLFWDKIFNPRKIVAIDNLLNDENVLTKYDKKDIPNIQQYYDIDQTDKERLIEIARKELSSSIDLVIDDASHLYNETKISFETLFPMIKENGFYIIEDWAWWHFPKYNNSFIGKKPLTDFVTDLIKLKGSSEDIINHFYVDQNFIAIQKGAKELEPLSFKIDKFVINRPPITKSIKYYKGKIKKIISRI
jgi:cephalosporin hydroxylase